MASRRRFLFLALDSASPELLRQWTDDGTLPTLAAFRSESLALPVVGPECLEIGATWPSFSTGRPPGDHGICWIDRVIPGTYRSQRMSLQDFGHMRPFWHQFSDAGRRVVELDVPFVRPVEALNGIQVCEWGCHDGIFGFHATPRRLRGEILDRWGAYPAPLLCDTTRLTVEGYRDLADVMIRGTELRGEMTASYLRDGDWDFGIQVFTELHCAGHLFWHFHDPGHPGSEPMMLARNGNLLRECYIAADRAVARIVETVDVGTTVMIGSLHGMQHTCGSSLLLPHMLEGLGVLRRAPRDGARTATRPTTRRDVRAWGRRLWHLIPERFRLPLYEFRMAINREVLHRGEPIDIDPTGTRAFQMGFGAGSTVSGIRLNLRGREPAGVLERGADADAFCAWLAAELHRFTDPETGAPLVRRVLRTTEVHPGARVDDLPDLLVEWHFDPPRGSTAVGSGAGGIYRGFSEKTGMLEHPNGSGRTGAHRQPGLLFARGPGIRPGECARTISSLDVAPTAAGILGCALHDTAGNPIPELLGDA